MTREEKVKKIKALMGIEREVKNLLVFHRKNGTEAKLDGQPLPADIDLVKLRGQYDLNEIHIHYENLNQQPAHLAPPDDAIDVTLDINA